MFGYVRINKPELKVREYEVYRGLYCSLCKAIGKYYGVLARLTLSYDITFLVLARLSLSGVRPCFKGGRCPFNPTKKCNYCLNAEEELKYAASVSMMLFYHKVRDNIADSSFFKRLMMYLLLPYASIKNRKAERLYPEISKKITASMERQRLVEKQKEKLTDKASHESADALGMIFCEGIENEKEEAYRFGYGIGKWVYLCDAADDIFKDLKAGSYNPFILRYDIETQADITDEIREDIRGQLDMSCSIACSAYDDIKEKTLSTIVENIIYEGTENTVKKILKGKN